ncbi:MAG: IS630 family transposase [Gammaproteobacteria bacterium]|jgi:transposase
MPKALKLKLKSKDLLTIKELLKYEEPRVIRRANVLNCLHLGYTSGEIAMILNVSQKTVANVGNSYLYDGLESALYDEERCGRPIDYDDRERSRIIAMVCSDPPSGAYRWTLDLIAEESQRRNLVGKNISREQVRIILQEHDLKPWQEKMWCIAKLDTEYIKRMEDILDIYERPYNRDNPVVCMDEKPVALISDSRDRLKPKSDGDVLKKDYEYVRNGSVNVFCAVEGKLGRYINKPTRKRNGDEFAKFMKRLSDRYGYAKKVILIMDNLSTHKEKSLINYYGEQEGKKIWSKFEVHYTPKHGSWLNQAEIAIGMYSRQCLGDGRIGEFDNLKNETKAWNKRTNRKATKINWRFTKKKARKSLNYKAPAS